MKGFFQWFKSSSKMKRWMFLILVGIILACYGLARILVMREISFVDVGQVVGIFVVGFLAIVIGLVFLNKRTLEVLIEASDERMENNKNVNMKSLIFNKTVYDKGPNIVVIGGGPAGMMAAITASSKGDKVILLEKMSSLGRKLLITGKGRCNITSSIDIKEFISNITGNGKFLFSAFNNYTNNDIIDFLNEKGVKVKEERGNRIFPASDKSLDVLNL